MDGNKAAPAAAPVTWSTDEIIAMRRSLSWNDSNSPMLRVSQNG